VLTDKRLYVSYDFESDEMALSANSHPSSYTITIGKTLPAAY